MLLGAACVQNVVADSRHVSHGGRYISVEKVPQNILYWSAVAQSIPRVLGICTGTYVPITPPHIPRRSALTVIHAPLRTPHAAL